MASWKHRRWTASQLDVADTKVFAEFEASVAEFKASVAEVKAGVAAIKTMFSETAFRPVKNVAREVAYTEPIHELGKILRPTRIRPEKPKWK